MDPSYLQTKKQNMQGKTERKETNYGTKHQRSKETKERERRQRLKERESARRNIASNLASTKSIYGRPN
jgi:hypothetical protein